MKQILVATDFSVSAGNALVYALKLAGILQLEVAVIHAIHPTEGINNTTYNAIFIDTYYDTKNERLKEWANEIAKKKLKKEIKMSTSCQVGYLKAVINKHIKNHSVEFLVMGVTGSTGIKGIIGSNTTMAVSQLRVPTIIVPLGSRLPKNPSITLSTDYSTKLSIKDVHALKSILKSSETKKMKVLYVTNHIDQAHIHSGEEKIKTLIPKTHIKFNYINASNATNGILDFINIHRTDLLCLVKHQHNIIYRLFTSSTINQVINQSVKAILILHD